VDADPAAEPPKNRTPIRRILSIDGGGINGTCPAAFLATLEEDTGQPIGRYFDLIAGTSTGGILAIGLAMGIPAKELLKLYVERGPYIFGQSGERANSRTNRWRQTLRHLVKPKHDADALRAELESVLGTKRIGDAQRRLLIPAWDADHRSVYIYKTAHHWRLKTDYKKLALDAAMATAAAPTYFRRHRTADNVGLLDGGVWANNPIALAVVEAMALLDWRAEDLRILSLGCINEVYMLDDAPGAISLGLDALTLFMDGQSRGALGMAKLLTGHEYEREAIFRYCSDAPQGFFKLDDTRKIDRLAGMGASSARKHRVAIEPVFLTEPAEPFEPVYKLPGDIP